MTLRRLFGDALEGIENECFATKTALALAITFLLLLPGFVLLLALYLSEDEDMAIEH